MTTLRFEAFDQVPALEPGIAYHALPTDTHFFRLTHVFPDCVYYVVVTNAESARHCVKPSKWSPADLQQISESKSGKWGRLELPYAYAMEPAPKSDRALKIQKVWKWIEPLVDDFDSEPILRKEFTSRIESRAEALGGCWLTIRRALLRYYYFGRTELALGELPRGRLPMSRLADSNTTALRLIDEAGDPICVKKHARAGRKSDLTKKRGPHIVTFDEHDNARMASVLKTMLTPPRQKTTLQQIIDEYTRTFFAEDHPEAFRAYEQKKTDNPVTRRIFRYRTRDVLLTEDQKNNLYQIPKLEDTGFLRAKAPGEICEADGTVGRVHLIAPDENGDPVLIDKANIYVFIDRWSRFINGVHITLGGNSYEQLRTALEYAFTDREVRFARLGVDASERRWPRSQIPTEITTDRGPEFLGHEIVKSVVQHLRIDHSPLKAYYPDGKAIVERFIRTMKKKMSARMRGTYASAITDRDTKYKSLKASEVAAETLNGAYRELLEIVMEYNNTPHTTLKKRGVLRQNHVAPTPQAAYLWGLKHIVGARKPFLSDDQFAKMLMRTANARLHGGILRFEGKHYQPVDPLAVEQAAESPGTKRTVSVKYDAEKIDLYMLVGAHRIAHFQATKHTLELFGEMAHDEAKGRYPMNKLADAELEDELHRAKIFGGQPTASRRARGTAKPLIADRETKHVLREREEDALRRTLQNKPPAPSQRRDEADDGVDSVDADARPWEDQEAADREEFFKDDADES